MLNMPAKNLIVEKPVRKKLLKLPFSVHQKIIHALSVIQENPMSGIKLQGELSNYYKFRVGDYRIIYIFNPELSLVEVIKVEHRQGVYR